AEPAEVKDAAAFKDGGSLMVRLAGKDKVEHEFIIRRSSGGPLAITKGPKAGSKTEMGGPEEQQLYRVLLRWADRHQKKAELLKKKGGDLDGEMLPSVQAMLIRLDNRITIYLGGELAD